LTQLHPKGWSCVLEHPNRKNPFWIFGDPKILDFRGNKGLYKPHLLKLQSSLNFDSHQKCTISTAFLTLAQGS